MTSQFSKRNKNYQKEISVNILFIVDFLMSGFKYCVEFEMTV